MSDERKPRLTSVISWLSVYGNAVKNSGLSDIQKKKLEEIAETYGTRKKKPLRKSKKQD